MQWRETKKATTNHLLHYADCGSLGSRFPLWRSAPQHTHTHTHKHTHTHTHIHTHTHTHTHFAYDPPFSHNRLSLESSRRMLVFFLLTHTHTHVTQYNTSNAN